MEEGKEEKEEVVVEEDEEDEASAPEPDDSIPCPVCCEYISAHEMHLHVNKCLDRSLDRQGNDASRRAAALGAEQRPCRPRGARWASLAGLECPSVPVTR